MSEKAHNKAKIVLSDLESELSKKIDSKFTGVLKLEIHFSQGGISKVFTGSRSEKKIE